MRLDIHSRHRSFRRSKQQSKALQHLQNLNTYPPLARGPSGWRHTAESCLVLRSRFCLRPLCKHFPSLTTKTCAVPHFGDSRYGQLRSNLQLLNHLGKRPAVSTRPNWRLAYSSQTSESSTLAVSRFSSASASAFV